MGRPTGVTFIAIILAIQAVSTVVMGLEATGLTSFGIGAAAGSEVQGWGYLISGALTLLVSFGLWALQGWARTIAIVVLLARMAFDVWAMVSNGIGSALGVQAIAQFVVSALVLWYLTTPGVRAAFAR